MASRDLIFTILGIDRASPAFDKVSKSADRTGKKLDSFGKTSVAALGGTVAAAAGAGAGIAAALGGTAALFGGLGIVAVASNERVATSFADLWHDIQSGTKEAAEPLIPVVSGIATELGGLFDEIQPRLSGLFTGSIPALHNLVDGFTGFTRETMPGLERAVASSGPVMESVRDVMIETGKGATQFFTSVSSGAESSARIMRVFGGIIRESLGFAGDMMARLSNEGAPQVERLGEVFTQLLGVIQRLSSGALPVLFDAAGVALNVFSGLLSVVGALSGGLGPLLGVVISTGVALKLLDTITFGGISAQFGKMKSSIGEADGMGKKLKAGLSSLTGGFGILGLASVGVGFALSALGEEQQQAARAAAQHRSNVESLSEALRTSNGVITQSVRESAAKALQDTQVADTGRDVLRVANDLGLSLPKVTDGYLGNVDAQRQLNAQLDEIIAKNTEVRTETGTAVEMLNEQGQKAKDLKDTLSGTNNTMSDAARRNRDLAGASEEAAAATGNHTTALIKLQEQLLGFISKDLAYRQAVNAEREAVDAVADAVRKKAEADAAVTESVQKHGAKSAEAAAAIERQAEATEGITRANLGWEQSMITAVAQAGEMAVANSRNTDAAEQARIKTEAQNREIIRLAQIAGNDAPPALRQMIAGMDSTAAAALGVTTRVNEAGQSVIRLPNGKEIVLNAADHATPVINEVKSNLASVKDRTVRLTVLPSGDIRSIAGGSGGVLFRAHGGPVEAGRPYIVGEQGRELFVPGMSGAILPNSVLTAAEVRGTGSASDSRPINVTVNVPGLIGDKQDLENRLVRIFDDLLHKRRIK